MKKIGLFFCLLLTLLCFSTRADVVMQNKPLALLLEINSAIGPATQDYIHRGLEKAFEKKANVVILQIDTPGGLDKSMHGIIKDIIASPVPVVAYVAPEGARAASAGTFIVYASSVAAMAPATNIGAASPVRLGGGFPSPTTEEKNKAPTKSTEETKVTNDAVAFIRSLAQLHQRNTEWAEKAVREGVSISAQEALQLRVIDLIAKNIPDLLQQIDGRNILLKGQQTQLHTKELTVDAVQPDWRSRFLSVITDPSVAYILLLLGAYGILFEFMNPGFMLPGVVGAICLLLALYALQLLPISYAGLGLILLGIVFMSLEAFMPSGALGVGGLIAFVAGSILLIDVQGYGIPGSLIFMMTLISIAFFGVLIFLVYRSRTRKVVSGQETLVGMEAEVRDDFQNDGWVKLDGEFWRARSNVPVKRRQKVKIIGHVGLILIVEPV